MDGDDLPDLFEESRSFSSADDIFSILEAYEGCYDDKNQSFEFQRCNSSSQNYSPFQESETEPSSPKRRRVAAAEETPPHVKTASHITVERNRRKQMNEHLAALRALLPCFYVKRGDQASIIEGVVTYIKELQQIQQSLTAKKQRKAYAEVVSPRLPSPLSSRLSLPISPRTPQPSSPYKSRLHTTGYHAAELSPCNSSSSSINELVATSKSAVAEVEVKFSGSNLLLKTVSHRIPGQAQKIVSSLENLPLEILKVNINTADEIMRFSFIIKIGIECQHSAEELAEQIQQTFC